MTAGGSTDLRVIVTDWLNRDDTAGYWLGYHVGSEFYGETDARFQADGRYELWSTVTEGRQRREFSGQCGPEDIRELVSLVAREELWAVHHVRPTQTDDDALARLEAGDGIRHGASELWVSEVESVPSFARVQDAVLELVRRLSAGSILETGH
jgi:hypothetical protein